MISIIISTHQPKYLKQLRQNISETVGIPFEIISIENKYKMGVCAAYNMGAAKANYNLLCFVHEDVDFVTENWGSRVVELFDNNKELALAGLAGAKYKSKYITGWTTGISELDITNVIQKNNDNDLEKPYFNPERQFVSEAVVLDGVCLFMPKAEWDITRFDERIGGYHFYDIDISLRISSQGKKVAVISSIELIHYSKGKFNNEWLHAAFRYHSWKEKQDLIKQVSGAVDVKRYDKAIRLYWFYRLATEELSMVNRVKLFVGNYKLYKEVAILVLTKVRGR